MKAERKKYKYKPAYSGKLSTPFWRRINAIKDKHKQSEAYTLGVVLQNIEEDILRLLNNLM